MVTFTARQLWDEPHFVVWSDQALQTLNVFVGSQSTTTCLNLLVFCELKIAIPNLQVCLKQGSFPLEA